MKTTLSFLLLAALSVSLSSAQTPAPSGGGGGSVSAPQPDSFPNSLPISPELLISNAKSRVKKVAAGIGSRSFVNGAKGVQMHFERVYVPSIPGNPDLEEMAALVPLSAFVFETSNPADPIQISVHFSDNTGRSLFEGSTSFKLVEAPDGSFAPPSSHISVPVWPSGELPLEISGADQVQLSLLNEQGETTEVRHLERDRNGAFLFPTWLAGQKYVRLTATDYRDDGTAVNAVYSSEDGKRQPVAKSSLKASVVIHNVIIIPADTKEVYIGPGDPQSERAFRNGTSPMVQVKTTKEALVSFYAETPSEVAKGFWIKLSSAGFTYIPIKEGWYTEIHLARGVYDVIFDWPTFGQRDGAFGERHGGKG